jgi:hypothetical protein
MNYKLQPMGMQTNLAVVLILSMWGLFLVTSSLHPASGDSHQGMMAVFPGLLLLALALLTYLGGRLLRRQSGWGVIAEPVVSVLVLAVVLALAFR